MEAYPSGPPSRRRMDPSPHDLATRIVALQRKNAAASAPQRLPPRGYEDVDEFNRGADRPGPSKTLFDPSRPGVTRLPDPAGLPPPPRYEPRDPRIDGRRDVSREDRRNEKLGDGRVDERPVPTSPRPTQHQPSRLDPRRSDPGKKLFNPDVHDPRQFASRSPNPNAHTSHLPPMPQPHRSTPPLSHHAHLHHSLTPSESSSSRSLLRRLDHSSRTPEEMADRERERRKRREGSERGSLHSRRKESDEKSKESRSSGGSESLKDRDRGKGKGDSGIKAVLKDIHNKIRSLEAELNEMHRKMASDPEAGIAILMEQAPVRRLSEADDAAAWMDLIGKHRELADLHHLFLVRIFDPLIPSTFQQLAVKYNIPSRLWQVSFHLILERLRLAWMTSHPSALDLLTDVVYDAYKFYTDLLEDQAMIHFRTAWIEALGDLARYRMTIASHVSGHRDESAQSDDGGDAFGDLEGPPDPSAASIGAEVAQSWDVEDKETWRTTAGDWYTIGITEKPGEGRLHHHLALLCRDVPGLESRALHHYAKSLVVTHEYTTSRETILPLFDTALQSQRSLPEANAQDLFVRLHGMLFTRIDLDNFSTVMSRYMERLDEDARLNDANRKARIFQVDWMTMASVNLAALLQYGSAAGFIRKALAIQGQERRRAHAAAEEDGEDDGEREASDDVHVSVDPPTPSVPPAIMEEPSTFPQTLTDAIEMTFAIFGFLLDHPFRQQGMHSVLNPYITTLLTFLATIFRQSHAGDILLPHIPWYPLVDFFNRYSPEMREESRLISGQPLPEDWTIRGMEWVGRRVYERGFWKSKTSPRNSGGAAQPRSGERFASEMDVLLANFESSVDISEGVVEAEEEDDLTDGPVAVNQRRWKRVAWAAGVLVKHVEGLELQEGKLVIDGALKVKLEDIERVKEAERIKEEQDAIGRRQRQHEEEDREMEGQEESDTEDSDPELAVLRDRRRHLQALLNVPPPRASPAKPKKSARKSLNVVPGYTSLVFDTNVLLSALKLVEKIIEGGRWNVIVPLPVITELDGLAKNPPPLGLAASQAISYLESRIKSRSRNLKIQTSRGNYLADLLIRTEAHGNTRGMTMDDLILNVAAFQAEHFGAQTVQVGKNAVKVLLVTFDRNLRLRARARGVDAADEKEMASILGK